MFAAMIGAAAGVLGALAGILAVFWGLGIVRPVVRSTIGRVTTIPQGCQKMGKDLNEVIKRLEQAGFTVKS